MLTRPKVLLHVEGAAVLAGAALVYGLSGHSWLRFSLLFFVPDVSMLGYAGGPRLGAALYNLIHSYTLPLLILAAVITQHRGDLMPYALIWLAHIGFDRMLGYGLKYPTQFKDTHLGRV